MEHEPIWMDGVDVKNCKGIDLSLSPLVKCKSLKFKTSDGGIAGIWCSDHTNCYFKQLARKTQECEKYKKRAVCFKDVNKLLGYKYLTIKQECEELKKQLMQKSEVDMFFNTPIEGWSNDPCGICPHKAENEELKKEIINKNEKIKELRFSVSDLTNRLCYLNAEKSFRIVDLEQTLDGIEKELKEDIYCKNQECGCDDFEECLKCTKEHILDIINKMKGEGNEE